MTVIEKLQMIERMDGLIRRKATGTPQQLAQRLQISERSVYNLIDQMKQLGGPIAYCKAHSSYHYNHDVALNLGFKVLAKTNSQISGGKAHTNLSLQNICSTIEYFSIINGR